MVLNFFLLFVIFNKFFIHAKLTEVVQTDKGPVQGRILQTIRWSVEYSSFQGIRYAKPPLGYHRFKAAEEADYWTEILQATSEPIPCPQKRSRDKIPFGTEDCLNLNVYSPKTNFSADNETNLLPVFVWIHGGALHTGSINKTNFGPDFLIENGVVVVAMNYRLGALGFLALNLPNVTGNAGLKDQVLALKWIQRNIKVFGGDPNSVTIFGISVGGLCVDYHVLSPASQGLFHRSISLSGSTLFSWSFHSSSEAEAQAFRLGRELGIFTQDKKTLLAALYQIPAENLAAATATLGSMLATLRPVIEDKQIAGSDAFLTECIFNTYKSGNFNQLPHLTGFMANESLILLSTPKIKEEAVIVLLDYFQKIESILGLNVRSTFPIFNSQDELANNDDAQAENQFIDDCSDVLVISGVDSKQKLLVKYGSAPVYYYKNSFTSNYSVHKFQYGIDRIGASHADDDAYVFYLATENFPTDPQDPFVITRDRILKLLTNFVKYSDPTPLGTCDPLLNITWPESGPFGTHLEIDTELSIVRSRPTRPQVEIYQKAFDAAASRAYECSDSSAAVLISYEIWIFIHVILVYKIIGS